MVSERQQILPRYVRGFDIRQELAAYETLERTEAPEVPSWKLQDEPVYLEAVEVTREDSEFERALTDERERETARRLAGRARGDDLEHVLHSGAVDEDNHWD